MLTYDWNTTGEQVASDCRTSIENKTVLITGVTAGGLGAGFATTIAPYGPSLIILATRSRARAAETAREIKRVAPSVATRILELHLTSQTDIRRAAKEVLSYDEHIDVLVNNAGIMAPPFQLTAEGVESQFGVNHIGHFLFTNLIMSKLVAPGKSSRVVNVSSDGHRLGPVRFEDWNFDDGNTYDPWLAYGQAKTANMLFSVSLAKRLGRKGLVSVSLHPGVINTNLLKDDADESIRTLMEWDKIQGNRSHWGDFKWKSMSQGVATHIAAAFHDIVSSTENNGSFLEDSTVKPAEDIRSWARDPIEAEKLWRLSEKIVGETFDY